MGRGEAATGFALVSRDRFRTGRVQCTGIPGMTQPVHTVLARAARVQPYNYLGLCQFDFFKSTI